MDEYNENTVVELNYTNRGSDYKHFYSANSKIWDTVAARYTNEADTTYIAWLAEGYAVISMPSEADMIEALRFFGLPWPMNVDEAKAAKLTELASAFASAEAGGHLLSAVGFEIDATERANRDVSGLVTAMSQPGAPESTFFCSYDNTMRPVTLANLRTMQLEIIAYGQQLYAHKWTLRNAIDTAETVEALAEIDLDTGWPEQEATL